MTNSFTDDINDNFESVKAEIESIKTNYTPLQVTNAINSTIANIPSRTSDLTNDSGFLTGINSSDVTTALGFTPYNSNNPNGYITGINSSDVTTALGYTPANTSLSNLSSTSTTNFDGQWVNSYSLISEIKTAGDFTINLGTTGTNHLDYLPQDNYSYLVQFAALGGHTSSGAASLYLKMGSDEIPILAASNGSYCNNTFLVVVDSSRSFDMRIGNGFSGRCNIYAMSYRRIGTNT